MIKTAIQITFILFIAGVCFGQIDPVDEWNLSGKVKAVTENSYTGLANGKEYVKGPKGWMYSRQSDSKIELDSTGNIIRRTHFDNMVKPIHTDEFTFEKGKLIHSKTLKQTKTFEYDSLGRISTEEIFQSIGLRERTLEKYVYDEKHRLTQTIKYRLLDSTLLHTKDYSYDERNNLILEKTLHYGLKDSLVYTYNSKNQLTMEVWFEDGKIVGKCMFEYIEGKVSYQKWEDYENGKPDGSVEYIYEKGNEKSLVDIDPDGTVAGKVNHSYTYDKTGNWTRKVTIIDDEEIFIVERKIEYY